MSTPPGRAPRQPELPPPGAPPIGYGSRPPPAAVVRRPPAAPAAFSFEGAPPRTASLGRRAAAYLLDFVLLGIVIFLLIAVAAVLSLLGPEEVDAEGLRRNITPVLLLGIPLFLVYFTVLEAAFGRTLGKATLGLRVERLSGGKPPLLEAFVRNLVRLLWGPALPSIARLFLENAVLLSRGQEAVVDVLAVVALAFLLLDLWLIQGTEMEQRLGDLAAGTVVVES